MGGYFRLIVTQYLYEKWDESYQGSIVDIEVANQPETKYH